MTRPFVSPWVCVRARRDAFTLIELLTVIAIILILAGLVLHIAGSANYRSTKARASTEVQAMSTALESYKADNGAYPRPNPAGTGSDVLNAQTDTDPGGNALTNYHLAGQLLYKAISGVTYTTGSPTFPKPYMSFTPGQLSTANATFTAGSEPYVLDPFGLPYGYSTVSAYAQEQGTTSTTAGYNPTFDLWSTAGYGTGGKSYASSNLPTPSTYNTLWAKNW